MRSVRKTCALACVGLAVLLGGCSLATAVDRDLIEEGPAAEGAVRGTLGNYANGRVVGWAMTVGDNTPVQVRIDVGGATVATVTADEFRPDLVTNNVHPTGNAGYSANVGDLASGSVIRAFVGDVELTNSPLDVD